MKRLRKPKLKDGELRMYWGREPGDSPDVMLAYQGDRTMKWDMKMLHYYYLAFTRVCGVPVGIFD